MLRSASTIFCVLLLQAVALADPPVAKLSGPTQRRTGRMIVLKTDGTVGDDIKIASNADPTEWYSVTFQNGTIGVIFETEKAGSYAFALAVNKDGKSAVAVHTVTVTVPGPAPPPDGPIIPVPADEFTKKLQNAYVTDTAAGVGTSDERKQLTANYRTAVDTIMKDCKIQKDLQDDMKELNDQHLKGRLPNLRAAIAQIVIADFGTDPGVALDKDKAKTLWLKLADSLSKLTP